MDGNLLLNNPFVFNEIDLKIHSNAYSSEEFLDKISNKCMTHTKSVDRNPRFNTPFGFNEIDL